MSPRHKSIRHLINPSSIALIGASDNPSRIGGRPLRILAERGYRGDIYPVNPKYKTVQGLRAYPSIASLPEGVDLYIIAIPAEAAVESFEEAAARGAQAAVMFSGGFAETGSAGRALQDRLTKAAAEYGVALLGPNSLGLASFANRSFATFATTLETMPQIEAGTTALVSQSGGTAFNLFTEAYWAGARFSHVIATGNEASLTYSDYLRYLATDQTTSAVVGYVEGVADGREFEVALAELRAAGKPVFMLRAGKSERGRRSVASHTAQVAGEDSGFDAVFDRFGVVRLQSMDDIVDVARASTIDSSVDGLAVGTNSGGAAAYLSDACDRYSVPIAELNQATLAALTGRLPPFAGLTNPVDFTPQVISDHALLADTLRILDHDPSVDVLLVFLGSMGYLHEELIDVLLRVRPELRHPVVLAWLGVSDEVRARAARAGLPVAADPSRVIRGLGLVRAGRRAGADAPGLGSATESVDVSDVAVPADSELNEATTTTLLEALGLRVPSRTEVATLQDALAAADQIGYPIVLKLLEPFMAHRARAGAVLTDIGGQDDLRRAYQLLEGTFDMRRALVVEQVEPGPDLIVGVVADETFGSRAVIGSGGIYANEIGDVRTLVPPFDRSYVEHVLRQLKLVERIEETAQGLAGVADDVLRVLTRLDALVRANRLGEIECNPLRITPKGAVVLDALAFGTAVK